MDAPEPYSISLLATRDTRDPYDLTRYWLEPKSVSNIRLSNLARPCLHWLRLIYSEGVTQNDFSRPAESTSAARRPELPTIEEMSGADADSDEGSFTFASMLGGWESEDEGNMPPLDPPNFSRKVRFADAPYHIKKANLRSNLLATRYLC